MRSLARTALAARFVEFFSVMHLTGAPKLVRKHRRQRRIYHAHSKAPSRRHLAAEVPDDRWCDQQLAPSPSTQIRNLGVKV
mmetsp:Transcript_27518/g.47848  ORF Transcript_27518/g.47848 Transcript_27518/m.47848 type:complete len:81 (-) Transcript_27518:316-558(-)